MLRSFDACLSLRGDARKERRYLLCPCHRDIFFFLEYISISIYDLTHRAEIHFRVLDRIVLGLCARPQQPSLCTHAFETCRGHSFSLSGEDEITNSFLSGASLKFDGPGDARGIPGSSRFIASFSEPSSAPSYEILDKRYCCHSADSRPGRRGLSGSRPCAREREVEREERNGKGYGMSSAYSLQII